MTADNSTAARSIKAISVLVNQSAFVFGLVVVAVPCFIMLAAGDGVVVRVHDQLDIEIGVYMLHAAHPFDGVFPEMMNGLPSGGAAMFSPGTLLFYLMLPPSVAFSANYAFVAISSYVFLFLCLRDIGARDSVCLVFAVAFAWLPFYSVYGLTAMGVPALVLALRWVWRSSDTRVLLRAIALTAFFAAFSSFADVGYAACSIVLVLFVFQAVKLRTLRGLPMCIALILATMVVVYGCLNFGTIASILGFGEAGASHRSEFVVSITQFSWMAVWGFFIDGSFSGSTVNYHAATNHQYIAVFCLVVLVVGAIASKGRDIRSSHLYRIVMGLTVSALAIALLYVAFRSGHVVAVREHLPGALRSFQADRFYFLLPTIWYIAGGVGAEYLLSSIGERNSAWKLVCAFGVAIPVAMTMSLSASGNEALQTSKVELTGAQAPSGMTQWSGFYQEEMFSKIASDIGEDQSAYRVVSIGLYPSIALYNGFYCLDGYVVGYPLEYKHEFEKCIEGELDASPALSEYFRGWGNRCYAFSHELGRSYNINKASNRLLEDPLYDFDAFYNLGCRYVFSAVEIAAPGEVGLSEIGHYSGESSSYDVYVYQLDGNCE